MKKKIFGIFVCILFFINVYAVSTSKITILDENQGIISDIDPSDIMIFNEPPPIQWIRTFRDGHLDYGHSAVQTSDGGYIIIGETYSDGTGNSSVWMIKTNSNGDEEWNKTFGGLGNDVGYCVQQTDDGGYIITGYTESYGAGWKDIWLIKTDFNGYEMWNKTFGDNSSDFSYCIQVTSDGGYIIVGSQLIKTDSDGNLEWSKAFAGNSLQQTSDGGYIIVGSSGIIFLGDIWLMKTDNFGNEEWHETYGGAWKELGHSVQQTIDGGYIIAGETGSYGAGIFDGWMVKTDSNGNMEWNKTFGGIDVDVSYSIIQSFDGGYIIAGVTEEYSSQQLGWLIKTDNNGNTLWKNEINQCCFYSVQQTNDKGFVLCGWMSDWRNVCLVKIAPEGTPNNPIITGPTSGTVGTEYEYNFVTDDPNGDDVNYYIEWGDGTNSGWIGPFNTGIEIIMNHSWANIDYYTIKAKAKDLHDFESGWTSLGVSMPKNKNIKNINPLLFRLIQRFPIFEFFL